MSGERSFKAVYAKYLHDVRTLTGSLPAEQRTLHELLSMRRPQVLLKDGTLHDIDVDELRRMAEDLPWYLHGFVKLPLVVLKAGPGFEVKGDRWTLRAVEVLLGRGLRLDPDPQITGDELARLLKNYKSLIFVSLLSIEEPGSGRGREDEEGF